MRKFLTSLYSTRNKYISFLIIFILLWFLVFGIFISFGDYLELRWSPRGRALFKSIGKKVVFIAQGNDFNDGKQNSGLTKILKGELKDIRIEYSFLGLELRFKMNYTEENVTGFGSMDMFLNASKAKLLQPLEQPIEGNINHSESYLMGLISGLICYFSLVLSKFYRNPNKNTT